ncbi:PKD domain-containing protein [Flavobacterium beibuense]|uniref:PKD domain-containing protein n=1 Tax=Flavobacterium beibuense TaxID=657326 RepID=UPI003A941877
MKKNYFTLKTLLIITTLFISIATYSQTWQWSSGGGSVMQIQGGEKTTSIVTDSNGNMYFLATIGKTGLQLDGMDLTSYDSGSNRDYIVASYDCSGTFRWSKIIGSGDADYIKNIQTDSEGNIYIAGTVYRTSQNFPANIDTDVALPYSPNDGEEKQTLFITKYNAEGEFQWLEMPQADNVTVAEAQSHSLGLDLQTDPEGNSYWLCILPEGTYANGAFVNTTEGDNFFILKYDTNGTFIEAIQPDIQFTGVLSNYKLIRNHTTGNFYIGGNTNSDGTLTINGETITSNMYIAAFNNQGNYLWKQGNTPGINGFIEDLCLDNNNNIYITGGTLNNDSFAGESFTSNQPHEFPFILKLNANGEAQWSTNAQTPAASRGSAITINNNKVAITASHSGITWGETTYTQEDNEGYDILLATFNTTDGSLSEINTIDTNFGDNEFSSAIAADSYNSYYIGGQFDGSLTIGENQMSNSGQGYDFFVAKYGLANCDCTLPSPEFTFEQDNEDQLSFSFTYTGSQPYDSIEWNFGDENTSTDENPSHTYTVGNTYNVCVTVTNDCGSETYCNEIEAVLNTESFTLAKTVIYPNPVKDTLNISSNTTLKYTIYSVTGSILKTGELVNGDNSISLSAYQAGSYMLELQTESGNTKTVKIFKK